MALQGTLETFSVPEVLRLLSGTRKTGLLALEGDRGNGNVWMDEGRIVAASSDHESAGEVPGVLFDLLRFREGAFVFETDARPAGEVVDVDVEEALLEAETLLEEWHEIESVVPSLKVWISMAPTISGPSVTVTADQWAALAIVGRGTSGDRLAEALELGELETSRRIHDLATSGLVEIDETSELEEADVDDIDDFAMRDLDTVEDDDGFEGGTWTQQDDLSVGLAGFVARAAQQERDELVDLDVAAPTVDDTDLETVEPMELEVDDDAAPSAVDEYDLDEEDFEAEAAIDDGAAIETEPAACDDAEEAGDPDEFLSQLANLSPKAAAAIEATASEGETAPSADRRPSGDGEGDEEINRNLLLKFLSSSKP